MNSLFGRKFVHSWDVFDTLIARRCGSHEAIFDAMEESLFVGFKALRLSAEATVRERQDNISIDDIYYQIQLVQGWTEQERTYALELEITTELENVIPINANIARVRRGDVLVSDMYLPSDVIIKMLGKAGFVRPLKLFVSANGKSNGTIWKQVCADHVVLSHKGDNPVSDFLVPLMNFIPASLTSISQETPWERMLRKNGAPALGSYIRESRLRSFNLSRQSQTIQAGQIECNFPLLLLTSAWLITWCAEKSISSALMSSRDCILWAPMAKKLAQRAGTGLNVEYFLTSRVAALKSSGSYLSYARRRINGDCVVVDLSMTGVSLAGLADRLGLPEVNAFVIALHDGAARSLYDDKFQSEAHVNFEYLFNDITHNDLEAFNQALTPSVHDVEESDDGLKVEYAIENRPDSVMESIKVQNSVFLDMLDRVPEIVLDEALALTRGHRLLSLIREVERHMGEVTTNVTIANPGAALRNDPNGIKLNLAYTSINPVLHFFYSITKTLFKPFILPGAPLYAYKSIPGLILRKLRGEKNV